MPQWPSSGFAAFPIIYGIWFYTKHRKANFFSLIGVGSVLITGGLIYYLWNADGSIKSNAAQLFGLKEGSIPLILGTTIFLSHWTRSPLLNTFLYSPQIFDIKKIESRIEENDNFEPYKKLLFSCTIIFAGSFLLSTVLNYAVAQHFLGGIDTSATDAQTQFAKGVSRLTFWGFIVIGAPIIIVLFLLLNRLVKGLGKLTGLDTDQVLLPR